MRFSAAALLVALALGALGAPLAAGAQPSTKVPRIGVLFTAASALVPHLREAFVRGLGELGYVEGRNIAITYRYAEGKYERLPELAAELVRLQVDLIFAPSAPAALAAKNVTQTIPIVFAAVADPVAARLVSSLGRPGGNITGLTHISVELTAKQLELLKETVPGVSRVAVLLNPASVTTASVVRETEPAAGLLRLKLQVLEVREPGDFDRAFSPMTREKVGGVLVLTDPMFYTHRARLADLAAKNRLPAIFAQREYAEAGGLMAYGASLPDLFRRATVMVDKILRGAKPANLPVEQPGKFELVINLKTAKALGLTIPQSILIRADQVIQ